MATKLEAPSPIAPSQPLVQLQAPRNAPYANFSLAPTYTAATPANLLEILEIAAKSSAGCVFYSPGSGKSGQSPRSVSYAHLYSSAKTKAPIVASLALEYQRTKSTPIVLLHFNSIEDSIVWFWATIIAGLTPAISTPLPANTKQRKTHLSHLAHLLEQPLVLTTNALLSEIQGTEGFRISTVEQIAFVQVPALICTSTTKGSMKVLMLTSGSSGNAKAVEINSEQILASMAGNVAALNTTRDDVFLNWIGFDHVVNFTEAHLHAMYLGATQIHSPVGEVVANPRFFLSLISEHKVNATFAPHFFLVRLLEALEYDSALDYNNLDLSCLRYINSGGEANTVSVTTRVTEALERLGARHDLINPGWGMTETCGGSICNFSGLKYDILGGYEFTSLGQPINGIKMRIVQDNGQISGPNELGALQVSGEIVFKRYYNNPVATSEAFTEDGWFITGDKALIDENGNLHLSGRDKEAVNLKGVKYAPHEIELALEQEQGERDITPSFTAVFSVRPPGSFQEYICVLYHPIFSLEDIDARIRAANAITCIVGTRTGARPKHIVPLPKYLLPKSALGKLSRAKLRVAFERGDFAEYEDNLNPELKRKREALCESPRTRTQTIIMQELLKMLDSTLIDVALGINSSIFDFGITSVDLLLLGQRIQERMEMSESIPTWCLLIDPTIRGIADSIDQLGQEETEHAPLVPLQKEGSKTPLFLVHPSSGDVLVFIALAKFFPDRPVYAFQTRCLYSGNNYFKTIHEMAECYYSNIKKVQPCGPYAIAGYSVGSSVAYEIAKLLERNNDKVSFLGILDSPPDIKKLISKQTFIDNLINICDFLEIMDKDDARAQDILSNEKTDDEVLSFIMRHATPGRLETLRIDKARLRKMTETTRSFILAGNRYKPKGLVRAMDIFWVTPEWMEDMSKWVEFSKESPRFHKCDGIHDKMLNVEYVNSIAKILHTAIQARGL